MNEIIKQINSENLRTDLPDIKVGDTVKVFVKITEGNKERIQFFEGLVLKRQGSGLNANFTVRRVTGKIGVERTFLVNSPLIDKIEVKKSAKVRRSKLYYMRERFGKKARLKEKRDF
ncbi:MAG TPA: 50S ribosomal protein L19 [Candidatus Mcinerneyibacteriales bacterium]|jgi:large subunit ribosomal protein L19|nr:50S ribosomal protein L19 [Candidatus Mcinerneyibacteriota bacterium]HOO59164.1 50S ribosomal protein L19 [Candidatus Mcinerneyibacteriales bacterium]HPE20671.1 50S ribosomal protein L19 [Candidatus Mcinerneyibacteriales bacterium]HPJ70082.1 50S ribosomal protein L19 [Candidatus Mcinerneyibacteriales bacterium]HPQ89703.1 50S ribosomal protein L19 [Candidatus Mcinerneyibacteriales bacterium]